MSRVVLEPGQLRRAWSRFLDEGKVPQRLVAPVIARSWTRCLNFGVPASSIPDFLPLTGPDMRVVQHRCHDLLAHARPVMENLHQMIAGTHSVILLSDASGLILHCEGDADFMGLAEQVALRPGVSWSETHVGTNAIGTAIVEKMPTVVYSAEHYVERNNFLTCSATPIFDARGEVLGVLDISADYRAHHDHTIGLVRLAAQMIERSLFAASGGGEIMLHFHPDAEYLGSVMEGQAIFDCDGQLLAANPSARRMLGLGSGNVTGMFTDYFEQSLGLAIGQARPGAGEVTLRIRGGLRVCARIEERAQRPITFHQTAEARPVVSVPSPPPARPGAPRLDNLSLGDERMDAAIHQAQRVRGRDISILIEGESGTGKEMLARAIHGSGPRAAKPFVAVNCAAIPEGLIESELFGYAEGAFTSAKRKGHLGKIQLADGGTLFLDEIGDMPLALQASLLRVLQERMVTPLGSTRAIPVDIAVICATHRQLRQLVSEGRFRQDLYYRLNGFALALPPLRERSDRQALAEKLFAQEGGGRPLSIDPQVMHILLRHPWPGNVRQLHNVARTAVALAGDDRRITLDTLPRDFLQEYQEGGSKRSAGFEAAPSLAASTSRLEEIEQQAVKATLEALAGNVSAAARQLGISRNTLYRKLKGP